MVVFFSTAEYFASCKDNQAKIAAIDAVIDALLITAASAAANNGVSEYMLNDGQTIIKQVYRNSQEIYNSINGFEQLRQVYVNRIQGRMVRLADSRNFINRRDGR
jgi:hypothetical protein